jgi:putative hydrolase of the HAD superfamily
VTAGGPALTDWAAFVRANTIGDNAAKDFVAPNAMGWTTVQVVRAAAIHDSAKVAPDGAARHIVGSLAELPDALGL